MGASAAAPLAAPGAGADPGRSRRGRRSAECACCGDGPECVADLRAACGVVEDAKGLAGLIGRQGERGAGRRGCGGGLRHGGKDRRGAQNEKNEKPGVKHFAHRLLRRGTRCGRWCRERVDRFGGVTLNRHGIWSYKFHRWQLSVLSGGHAKARPVGSNCNVRQQKACLRPASSLFRSLPPGVLSPPPQACLRPPP